MKVLPYTWLAQITERRGSRTFHVFTPFAETDVSRRFPNPSSMGPSDSGTSGGKVERQIEKAKKFNMKKTEQASKLFTS